MDAHEISLYNGLLITGLFVIALTLCFAVVASRLQRKHIRLQRQNFLAEIGLLEKERRRVAGDLHDELAPRLSLTRFQLARLAAAGPAAEALVQQACTNLEWVMLRMGEIAVNLNANVLHKKGFRFAVGDFLLELECLSTLKTQFSYAVTGDIPAETAIHLYRIVQEVVHNVFKHARATKVEVRVQERGGKLLLFIADDGEGFCYAARLTDSEGLGLRSIRSRTGMLGGRIECRSAPKEGTAYSFEFPLFSTTPS